MAKQLSGDTWGERLTLSIGKRLQGARIASGLSVQNLADETARLGHQVPRQAIVNLESGRKSKVAIDDLFILAHALHLNPLTLVFDPKHQGTNVEVLPGLEVPQWEATLWASGHSGRISSILYGDDFDNARSAFQLRLDLDDTQRRLESMRQRLMKLRSDETIPGTTEETRSMRIDIMTERITTGEDHERRVMEELDKEGVQRNDAWFDWRAISHYQETHEPDE